MDFCVSQILLAYLLMLIVDSNIFIHTLISTHFAMETKFPSVDEEGVLPYSYAQHQLETSLDYYPSSSFANFIFSGSVLSNSGSPHPCRLRKRILST